MLHVLALVLPWLAIMLRGKLFAGLLLLILQCTMVGWIPATIVAWIILSSGGSGSALAAESGGIPWLLVIKYYIPALGEADREEIKDAAIEAAKGEGISPDIVVSTVGATAVFDRSKSEVIFMNDNLDWFIPSGMPAFNATGNRLVVYSDVQGMDFDFIADKSEIVNLVNLINGIGFARLGRA